MFQDTVAKRINALVLDIIVIRIPGTGITESDSGNRTNHNLVY